MGLFTDSKELEQAKAELGQSAKLVNDLQNSLKKTIAELEEKNSELEKTKNMIVDQNEAIAKGIANYIALSGRCPVDADVVVEKLNSTGVNSQILAEKLNSNF